MADYCDTLRGKTEQMAGKLNRLAKLVDEIDEQIEKYRGGAEASATLLRLGGSPFAAELLEQMLAKFQKVKGILIAFGSLTCFQARQAGVLAAAAKGAEAVALVGGGGAPRED